MSRFPYREKVKFHVDITLTCCLGCLMILSLAAIWCAAVIMINTADPESYWIRQAAWYLLSIVIMIVCVKMGTDRFYSGARIIYWILIVLLSLLLVDRYWIDLPLIKAVNGTTAWFQIPKLGSFQPAEFMKIVLIILVGDIIHRHNLEKKEMSFAEDLQLYVKILKVALPPLVLILLEPETGIPIVVVISILVMCALSGVRREWILGTSALLIILIAGVIYLYKVNPELLETLVGGGYKLNRLKGWLDTEKYASSYGYQLFQSLLAIGSSGWTGFPLRSVVIYFSEPQTDFIFAVICQNFGLIGAAFTVILCALLDMKLLLIAYRYPNSAAKYTLLGLIGMLVFQQLENMGMVLGLFPITGIPLPFISYGGSSMLSTMIPMALVYQMSHENKVRTLH